MAVDALDIDLAIVFGTAVASALIARWTRLPITALEIVVGILLITLFRFDLPVGTDSLLTFGGLLIVFLVGLETNLGFLRANLRRALTIGLGGFLVPFAGLFALLYYGLNAPLIICVIGATALADTSISIVYTTLMQYDLADLPFGRLVLAATLSVNVAEDFTITGATLLTTPGLLFTVGVLGALAVAALLLPRLSKLLGEHSTNSSFSNINGRTLFFTLAILALLSGIVGVPGILFVFLLGLMFSPFAGNRFLVNIQQIAFATFIPLYFIAVGLKVDLAFVLGNLPLLVLFGGVASALKLLATFPLTRIFMGRARAGPVALLMNTRLTSATVILTLSLSLGLLPVGWYSIFISAVVVLALGSVLALRALPSFRTPASAHALFASSVEDEDALVGFLVRAPLLTGQR